MPFEQQIELLRALQSSQYELEPTCWLTAVIRPISLGHGAPDGMPERGRFVHVFPQSSPKQSWSQ